MSSYADFFPRREQFQRSWPPCVWEPLTTTNVAALPGQLIPVDSSGGSVTVSLPAAPQHNDIIGVARVNDFVTTNTQEVVIDAGTNSIEAPRPNILADLLGILLTVTELYHEDETAYWQFFQTGAVGVGVWKVVATANIVPLSNNAILDGTPNNQTAGTGSSPNPIQGWDNVEESLQMQGSLDPVTGTFTAPAAGTFEVEATIIAQQGNSNKELAIMLWAMLSIQGNFIVSVFDVATDKTDYRAWNASFSILFAQNETMQLGLTWNGDSSPGTLTMHPSQITITYREVL